MMNLFYSNLYKLAQLGREQKRSRKIFQKMRDMVLLFESDSAYNLSQSSQKINTFHDEERPFCCFTFYCFFLLYGYGIGKEGH
jgi:hypothetical protein